MLVFIPECFAIISHHLSVSANYVPLLPFEMRFVEQFYFFVLKQ